MPPAQATAANGVNKKKKKGPAPAHQNKFAWRHNPKSKKTDIILASPNVHVCRRCYEKIEWRKQYRKYKPLTQPSKCNLCEHKNVKAAYHTICTKCSQHSTKAKAMIEAWNNEREEKCRLRQLRQEEGGSSDKPESGEAAAPASTEQTANIAEKPTTATSPQAATEEPVENDEKKNGEDPAQDESAADNEKDEEEDKTPRVVCRVCAVCVKEPALPASDDEEEDEPTSTGARITLRERKRLEREQEKKKTKPRKQKPAVDGEAQVEQNDEDGSEFDSDSDEDSDDDDDPFLRAVGGAENLLTGEAYQQKLLASQQN